MRMTLFLSFLVAVGIVYFIVHRQYFWGEARMLRDKIIKTVAAKMSLYGEERTSLAEKIIVAGAYVFYAIIERLKDKIKELKAIRRWWQELN